MGNLIDVNVHAHGLQRWTYLREKVEKFNHPVNSTEFPRVSARVDKDVHTNGPAAAVPSDTGLYCS